MYIGHKREDGGLQPLKEHLTGTAERAAAFAAAFGAQAHGYRAGLQHDIGKYGARAQRRMNDPEHTAKVDHSTAGAKLAFAMGDCPAAFAVAGHHSGLMNLGTKRGSMPSDGTLWGRIKAQIDEDYGAYAEEIAPESGALWPRWAEESGYAVSFYTRMLFSCLVDADFLDTEAFMREEPALRGGGEAMETLLAKLRAYVAPWFPPKTALNEKRCEILNRCLCGADFPRGLYTLTVPTGGGKTVSSLAFALTHAAARGQKRVIYVVPYTSIIEQNADVFAQIVGAENVLEHHSGVELCEEDDGAEPEAQRKRLATENWDAPIVVTTAVQFFESLYATRTSKCRKLHNIADAVIVFDEAQMMPLPYLRPCVAVIAQLVRHYGATAVLCTATQPALDGLFRACAPDLPIREIVEDAPKLYDFFRRVRFEREGKLTDEAIAQQVAENAQALCIVNSRKRAQAVFDGLPEEGRFHLSTLMTPDDRRRTIAAIRQRLKDGAVCRVAATSLIEAGVDVDFPTVWREEAGLDSILQAAGRCNREGRCSPQDSVVHVFEGEGGVPPMFGAQVGAMRAALETTPQMDSPQAVRRYFELLLTLKGDEAVDQHGVMGLCEALRFRDAADNFHLIDSATQTIYIPNEENAERIDALRGGWYTKKTLRQLQRDSVNVYEKHYNNLAGAGKLDMTPDGFAILCDEKAYDCVKGLTLSCDPGMALFV